MINFKKISFDLDEAGLGNLARRLGQVGISLHQLHLHSESLNLTTKKIARIDLRLDGPRLASFDVTVVDAGTKAEESDCVASKFGYNSAPRE